MSRVNAALVRLGCALWLSMGSFALGASQEPLPPLRLPRWREDYSRLTGQEASPYRRMKRLILNDAESAWLSLGGEYRLLFADFSNEDWGRIPDDPGGRFFHRLMAHGDLKVGTRFRIFGEWALAGVTENRLPAGPVDSDQLDLHQAFADFKMTDRFWVRLGRQELQYGSARILSIREGPNMRLSFDGALLAYEGETLRVDAFAVQAVQIEPGFWNNSSSSRERLWGAYSTFSGWEAWRPEFYYLGYAENEARFAQGSGEERRHSIGLRSSGRSGDWDFNFESLYQFGSFAEGRIMAWTLATDTGWTTALANRPIRMSLKMDVASGDRDPGDSQLNTFNALYPRGRYFGWPALIGPRNFMDIHPEIALDATENLKVIVDWDVFWRESPRDAIYDPAGQIALNAPSSRSREVGSQAALEVVWQATREMELGSSYARFFRGEFARDAGAKADIDFVNLWWHARF